MPLRIFHPGILSLLLLVHPAQGQSNSAPAADAPNLKAGGGYIRDSRQHPAEPSRDYAFSMTINRYGIAATLQTLASQASATILSKGGNAVDAAIAANAAVGVIEPMMNGMGETFSPSYGTRKRRRCMPSTRAAGPPRPRPSRP